MNHRTCAPFPVALLLRNWRIFSQLFCAVTFHTMRPNHDSPGGGLGRYSLNRKLFRFYSDERAAPVLCLTESFFPDDSQPIIVAVLPDPVLQAPCPYALTALLPLSDQSSPLVHSCDSLCFRYCHTLLSIVFQVRLIFWIPVFQALWIVSHVWSGSSRRGIIERLQKTSCTCNKNIHM